MMNVNVTLTRAQFDAVMLSLALIDTDGLHEDTCSDINDAYWTLNSVRKALGSGKLPESAPNA